MPTTLTIIPVAVTPYYRYVMLKETDDGHESLMTTAIQDNQDPIETAITHAIKETGITNIKAYFELNPLVSENHTNKIVILYFNDTDTNRKDYGWIKDDDIESLFIPDGDYVISDPLVYTATLLLKEYDILYDNEQNLTVLAHEDHQFYNFDKHADKYGTAYYYSAPTKRELNSLLKLVDKWDLTVNDSINDRIGLCPDKNPDYAIAIEFNIDNSYNLTTFDCYNEETKRFDTYQKLINYADHWFTKQTKED
jgi:hypothetical protein